MWANFTVTCGVNMLVKKSVDDFRQSKWFPEQFLVTTSSPPPRLQPDQFSISIHQNKLVFGAIFDGRLIFFGGSLRELADVDGSNSGHSPGSGPADPLN
ncbi:hypothetical protein LWI28_022993 [Acer negundo]|uniref:Uncharacterized protein n=1 Tax=Acer negundo TaxID=4023 RepID=A0AAD5IFT9_ACENE|nr:hypothetical protein LWI28_022993 [Acer negundo]